MKVALVLHLYQPPMQSPEVFKKITAECYIPLLKIIKNKKNHKFTLNVPLSLLEQMDKYGYYDWLQDLKTLYEQERVEITGSAAYHPLLTKIPENLVEEQIILNEYGLGYYFGTKHGFEGEPSIMVKNIQGFFPPEMAVNYELAKILSDLGYKWFMAEDTCLPPSADNNKSIYTLKDLGINVVCRDSLLSNMLSFKRETNLNDILSIIYSKKIDNSSLVLSLDGEYFGHHYPDGIYLLDYFLGLLEGAGIFVSSVSDMVDERNHPLISEFRESSWGASKDDWSRGDIYPFWYDNNNSTQLNMWKLQYLIISQTNYSSTVDNVSDMQNIPIWNISYNKDNNNELIYNDIIKYINLHKFLNSDKFWWLSKKSLMGKNLYNPEIVRDVMKYADIICTIDEDTNADAKYTKDVKVLIGEIIKELK